MLDAPYPMPHTPCPMLHAPYGREHNIPRDIILTDGVSAVHLSLERSPVAVMGSKKSPQQVNGSGQSLSNLN